MTSGADVAGCTLHASAVRPVRVIVRLPDSKTGAHLVNLEKPWRRLRKAAGLDDVRLHDLRRSLASVGAGTGMGLPMIGKLLGHSQPQTTARYAHLDHDPVTAANEAIGRRIAAAVAGEPAAKVVKLRRVQR
jgi:integrase